MYVRSFVSPPNKFKVTYLAVDGGRLRYGDMYDTAPNVRS